MIQAVVFDFDGTIFDSESHVYGVARELFEAHGAELPLDVWAHCVGREAGYFDVLAYLEECTGRPVDREALTLLRRERFNSRIVGTSPAPGIQAALAGAREMGLRLGVASSGSREWVEGQLARLGIREHFACVVTADDVERVKPEPDLYLRALDCLGAEPARAIAIEDSPNGALAARRAGMYCVVVPNPVTAALAFGDHHLRLDTLDGVEFSEIVERLAATGPAEPPGTTY
ncbi:MAG TPA: HAD family hydrolase [Longimicrobium sp.]|nr:HAD family hydrolase [Longimicrobium sp.]